jgi:hypothetical protein
VHHFEKTHNPSWVGYGSKSWTHLDPLPKSINDLKLKDIILPNQVIIAWVLNSLNEEYSVFTQNITQLLRNNPKAYTFEILVKCLIDELRGKDENAIYSMKQIK